MKTIIVVSVLVLLAHATNLQNEMAASLADLGDHPFGKSMVSLLNMNMKTGSFFDQYNIRKGGPLHELRTLLQQIKDELIALTQVQDQEWTQSQRRCQVDIAQLTATLEQAQADLESQRQEQTALLGEQTTLNARVREDTSSLERNGKAQNDAVDRLNSENSDFDRKNQDYDDAINACKEAQRLLMNLRTEGSALIQLNQETQMNLIQTKENFKKIKDILEQHSKKTSLTLFQPIIEGLVEMSTSVNPETLNNVLNLIARLITALQEGQDQLREAHTTQVANLQRLQGDLKSERDTLNSAVATGNNRLKEIQSRLNELDGLLRISNAIVEVTTENLADAKTGCTRKEDEYNNQKVSRQTELDIVDRLIQFVNERLAAAVGE